MGRTAVKVSSARAEMVLRPQRSDSAPTKGLSRPGARQVRQLRARGQAQCTTAGRAWVLPRFVSWAVLRSPSTIQLIWIVSDAFSAVVRRSCWIVGRLGRYAS